MTILLRPVRYLSLVDERGRRLHLRNLLVTVLLAAILAGPFIMLKGAIFFRPGGFVERAGSFASVLTGFYIAALVAVATFAAHLGDMDSPISVGRIIERRHRGTANQDLSRREYVCALFGYLAFLSLVLSIGSILLVVITPAFASCLKALISWLGRWVSLDYSWFRGVAILAYTLLLASLLVHSRTLVHQ
jgi:hypothetical protein